MGKRSYSDREKAEALAVYDSSSNNVSETSRITGVPPSTLYQWIQGTVGVNDDIPDMREFKKLELAEKLDRIAHQCAGLLPGKLPDSNVREIVGAMSQSIEKGQLLRGSPTSIVETSEDSNRRLKAIAKGMGQELSDEQVKELMAESFKRAEQTSELVS